MPRRLGAPGHRVERLSGSDTPPAELPLGARCAARTPSSTSTFRHATPPSQPPPVSSRPLPPHYPSPTTSCSSSPLAICPFPSPQSAARIRRYRCTEGNWVRRARTGGKRGRATGEGRWPGWCPTWSYPLASSSYLLTFTSNGGRWIRQPSRNVMPGPRLADAGAVRRGARSRAPWLPHRMAPAGHPRGGPCGLQDALVAAICSTLLWDCARRKSLAGLGRTGRPARDGQPALGPRRPP